MFARLLYDLDIPKDKCLNKAFANSGDTAQTPQSAPGPLCLPGVPD